MSFSVCGAPRSAVATAQSARRVCSYADVHRCGLNDFGVPQHAIQRIFPDRLCVGGRTKLHADHALHRAKRRASRLSRAPIDATYPRVSRARKASRMTGAQLFGRLARGETIERGLASAIFTSACRWLTSAVQAAFALPITQAPRLHRACHLDMFAQCGFLRGKINALLRKSVRCSSVSS